ncbi:SPARC-related modular calcium-binding protein 1 isoform X1 [Coccinella septempunctata]|uniref:SPARC-related modular calcium-binding protein 1 isoform X1 n=1 Tax=Coccinella septempunctata TaxID=41139 RepID=UPI001D089325|nr:SPARC-related modular calcium-binding protein 1 isoform X1 [Coccinella septempunctata]
MWLHIFFSLGLVVLTYSTDTCKPKACEKKTENEKPVCGSDGLTYPNRCHFEKARCQIGNITLVRKGPCKQHRPCFEAVEYAKLHPGYSFKPQCRSDGSYSASQCHPDTGYCWCVTPMGVPLPFTSVQSRDGVKHRCGRKNRKSKKRSPSKKNHARPCKLADKSNFNGNLIGMFLMEWQRDKQTSGSANDTVVIEWKFTDLDANSDGVLDKTEYKDLKRMVKKAVKPKRCGKTFFRTCDLNSDHIIERDEWADCLARNGMDVSLRVFLSLNPEGRGGNTNIDSDEGDEEMEPPPSRSPPHGVLNSDGNPMYPSHEDDSAEIHEEEPANCLSDRQTAFSEGSHQLYIPECTSDGRYHKVQCYKSAGYCWCVNEDTGKNIPGTSIKNATPKCDDLLATTRPMKGCPEEKKVVFLKDLMQFLQTKMNTSSTFTDLMWKVSKEEQTAKLSFVMLDKNKNKMLDKHEWKSFKDMVLEMRTFKKCGKKLPRYCDINRDRQISMTEWLLCLNVQQAAGSSSTNTMTRSGKENPLSILKAD